MYVREIVLFFVAVVVELLSCLSNSPPASSDHGISQAGMLEWVVISSSKDLPDPGVEPASLHLLHWQAESLPLSHLRRPLFSVHLKKIYLFGCTGS